MEGGFAYAIGVPLGIVLVITIITLTSYFCNRVNLPNAPSHHGIPVPLTALSSDRGSATASFVKVGLDEATLRSYPILLYPQAKLLNKVADDSTTCCCSICLGDYKDTDLLRLLPVCDHLFHQNCVDQWLQLNPLCPVCRNSLQPTPLSPDEVAGAESSI